MDRSDSLEDADKPEGTPAGNSVITKASAVRLVVASVVTLGVVVGVLITRDTGDSSPATNSDAPTSTKATPTPRPPSAPVVAGEPKPFATDIHGFLDPGARCGPTQNAVAIGRTEKSLVVICDVGRGRYEYKGVRLSLGAGVSIRDVTANAEGFVARNEDITYTVTPTELVIRSANAVIAREPMVEHRRPQAVRAPAGLPPSPRPAALPAPPRPGAPPPPRPATPRTLAPQAPPSPQSSNKPIDGYPLPPVTARGTGNGIVRFTATKPWQLRYRVDCPAKSPVRGSINAGASYTRYHVALRGAPNARVEGMSPSRDQLGPIVVSIALDDQRCGWELSI